MSTALRIARALPARNLSSLSHQIPAIIRLSYHQHLHAPPPSISATFGRRRTLATHATDRPPSNPAQLVRHPTQADLDAADVYADALPPAEAHLELTDRAAEQLQRIAAREKSDDAALRVAVESGGCHGYQYKMELAKAVGPDDYVFSHPTIAPARVVVDAVSLGLLKGSTVDFATELIGSTFRVLDNPQAKGAGCGCGVSWEANV